jgi:acyl-coenzyme A synthetase/AMP-(fatty) acid ligase
VNPISSFFEIAKARPSQIAVATADLEMSFGDLAGSVKLFSAAFQKLGIGKGDLVAIAARTEVECIAVLALMQLGAISLSGTDSVMRSYRAQIQFLVTDNDSTLFSPGNTIKVNPEFLATLGQLSAKETIQDLDESDIVRIVFSSGTTGTPKGVPFSAKNLLARINSAHSNWMPALPFMSLLGLDTVTGMQTFYWHVFNGQTYIAPRGGQENLTLIQKFAVRSIKTSPARLKDLIVAATTQSIAHSFEVLQVAGSLLNSNLSTEAERVFGVTPTYLYGSTEVGTVTRGLFKPTAANNVGTPVSDIEIEIVDDFGKPVSNGLLGTIRYRKPGMPEGYWLDNQRKSRGFNDGWFYPGDLGVLNQAGELEINGRADDVVNIRGSKFNLLELDTWLAELGLFEESASFLVNASDDSLTVGIAFVSRQDPIPELLSEKLKAFIPDLEFSHLLRLKNLPRNRLDKVDRGELSRRVAEIQLKNIRSKE